MPHDDTIAPSGRFVLRVPPALHARLRREAEAEDTSLNDWCNRRLSGDGGVAEGLVRRAREVLGDHLVGLVAYGSWARGDAGKASDVDILVIVDLDHPLTRDLYRQWDAHPVTWEGRAVDAHFVHLGEGTSGLWVEAAIDGIVLLDRGHVVARRLVQVRNRIADGSIVRRVAHGQPYWIEASPS